MFALSRRKQGFDSPWERQAQNKRSLLNGYQKIWRRFCDAVPLRIKLARDLFGEKALMGARLVKHRLVGIESNRGWRCRSCDRQSSSEFGRLLRYMQGGQRHGYIDESFSVCESSPSAEHSRTEAGKAKSHIRVQSPLRALGRDLGPLVHSKGLSATASSAPQASIS